MRTHLLLSVPTLLLLLPFAASAEGPNPRILEADGVTIFFDEVPDPDRNARALAAPLALEELQKVDVGSDRLVLPRFQFDGLPGGTLDTLFAVRNTTTSGLTVDFNVVSDFEPAFTVEVPLAGKETRSFSVRNLFDGFFAVDEEGMARGYLEIDVRGFSVFAPTRSIQGDYFLVDPANNFASGDRLINRSVISEFIDLCRGFEVRFFNGGTFDGGTEISFWLERLSDSDREVSFSVFSEGGTLLRSGDLGFGRQSVSLQASLLALDAPFGVIEFVFNDGILGYATGVFSALGRFSVGVNASCSEPRGPIPLLVQ
ncbi:MAG: hypothetical protein AAF725_06020, partial [Acidobacteriota bacterium]